MSQLLLNLKTDETSVDAASLLARIRQATRAQHDRCEAHMDLAGLASCVEAYADALLSFQSLHAFVVANSVDVVALAPADLTDGLTRGRLRLGTDLAALGLRPPAASGEPAHEALAELGAQLGAWYVLEGSALGGRVIARHVRGALGQAAGALSYFSGEGPATGSRWQRFGAFAQDLEAGGAVHFDAVCRGAELTFDHFLSLPARL